MGGGRERDRRASHFARRTEEASDEKREETSVRTSDGEQGEVGKDCGVPRTASKARAKRVIEACCSWVVGRAGKKPQELNELKVTGVGRRFKVKMEGMTAIAIRRKTSQKDGKPGQENRRCWVSSLPRHRGQDDQREREPSGMIKRFGEEKWTGRWIIRKRTLTSRLYRKGGRDKRWENIALETDR